METITVVDPESTLTVVAESLSVAAVAGDQGTLTVTDEGIVVAVEAGGGALAAVGECASVTVIGGGEQVIEVGIEGPQGPRGEKGDRGEPGPAGAGLVGFESENKDSVTLAAGVPVAAVVGGSGVRRARAASAGYECCGLASESFNVGFAALVLVGGTLTLPDWSAVTGSVSLTAGLPYYLSTTAGMLTSSPPSVSGQRVQQVGVAVSPDTLLIEVTQPVLL